MKLTKAQQVCRDKRARLVDTIRMHRIDLGPETEIEL